MKQPRDRAKKKTLRTRLLQFYDNLKGFFQVDTEDFYRRVVQQAEAAERRSRPR